MGSVAIHGRVANVVFQTGPHGCIARGYVPQRKGPSDLQKKQNRLFGVVSDQWRVLSDEEKKKWDQKASNMKITGYNLYLKENMKNPPQVYGMAKYGFGVYS